MTETDRLFALVPCAGVGARAVVTLPKQYAPIAGQPMVAWTLAALARVERLHATLVVLASDDLLFDTAIPAPEAGHERWVSRCGGSTRAATVANGLAELLRHGALATDWVLVHDAARCLLQPEWVDRLIDECLHDAVGGLLALPLADTLKSEVAGRSVQTIDRAGKWIAQTPQMFRIGALARALDASGDRVTDEASAIEATGQHPKLVLGDGRNLKVTWPADFALAAMGLAHTAETATTSNR